MLTFSALNYMRGQVCIKMFFPRFLTGYSCTYEILLLHAEWIMLTVFQEGGKSVRDNGSDTHKLIKAKV
jgi:hypothetical protein